MKVRQFGIADASFEQTPGQNGEVFAGNVVDQRHGGPITIGYGRYSPHAVLKSVIAVHDVMIILEGRLTITSEGTAVEAGPGEIVYMPEGNEVTIRAQEAGAVTAYVTYPHWQEHE
jgi:ethanolamine utilization protein EutQ (cupin superfamily)